MASISLYDTNPLTDASHQVQAPGGYEWWYFDAEDPATDTQVVAIFLHGFVFHPGYLRAIDRYEKKPTTTPPPTPSQFPCVYLCVYRGGKILHQFMTQVPENEFSAARDTVDVMAGTSRLQKDDSGALRLTLEGTPWELTWHGPNLLETQTLFADLTFTPTFDHPPAERVFLSRAMTGAEHRWVIANPKCAVSGSIKLKPGAAGEETISFTGQGYHDHNFGTGPLGPGLRRWIWGRVLLDDRVMTFHYALPRDRSLPDEVHLVEADAEGIREIGVLSASANWSRRSHYGLAFPKTLAFDERLVLSNPRLIDSTPFYMRLTYDARVNGQSATAFCEVAQPNRLRWPILGRMIEMSIDKRSTL